MRIKSLSIGLLLFVVLAVHPVTKVSADMGSDVINAGLPALAGLIGMVLAASPAAPFLVAGLGLIHVFTMIVMGAGPTDELTTNELLKTKNELMNKLNDVDAHISESTSKIINELSYKIESSEFFKRMRRDLETFKRTYEDKMSDVLNPKKPAMTRITIDEMINYHHSFRSTLASFITTYIKPSVNLQTSRNSDVYLDYILEENRLLALENEDCNQDSLHYKIFKSYIYITKYLTDAYVMVLAAHIVRYQEELSLFKTNDANGTRETAGKVLKSYKNDMAILMARTKWALENSSREIKNCGTIDLKEGVTFARLPFVTTIAKFKSRNGLYTRACRYNNYQPVSPNNFLLWYYDTSEFSMPVSGSEVYYNPSDLERPFSHVKFGETTLGHADGVPSSRLSKFETDFCLPDFFNAYNRKAVGISTQRAAADPGNVITGVRFKVRKNVLYIDIQEGKFISELEVDPNTLKWKQTKEDDSKVVKFTPHTKIEIADHEVKDRKNLTSIQFVENFLENAVELYLNWEENPNGDTPLRDPPLRQEINLDDRDDPAMIAADAKRLISRHPDSNFAYVLLQPTSFKKDLGRTTIPYIDMRDVVTNPPSPVIGMGIYHAAAKGDGGLLALKLIQPILTKYVNYTQVEQFATPEVITKKIN